MKKLMALTMRNFKEILRDPLTTVFTVGFPIVMLVLMQTVFSSIGGVAPVNFAIEYYAPGICVFGYTFTAMFVASSISADKNDSFIKRITIAPVKRSVYLLSFLLSGLAIAIVQTILFFAVSLIFGLPASAKTLLSALYLLPSILFFLSFGVFIGNLCKNEKQSAPICSIMVSVTGILGGIFMPITLFSGALKTIVNVLPFAHSTLISAEVYTIGASAIYPHALILLGYIAVLWLITALTSKK